MRQDVELDNSGPGGGSIEPRQVVWPDPSEVLSQPENTAVSVSNSSDVQVGPRLLYNAPVTINQFVTSTPVDSYELACSALTATHQFLKEDGTVTVRPVKSVAIEDQSNAQQSPCSGTASKKRVVVVLVVITVAACVLSMSLLILPQNNSSQSMVLQSDSKPPLVEVPSDVPTTQTPFVEPPVLVPPPDEVNPNRTLPGGRKIWSKQDWGGQPAIASRARYDLRHPTPYAIISHTAGATCFDVQACAKICRSTQDSNVGGKYQSADIAFNFLVGGDGSVFEGRGWDIANARDGLPEIKRNNVDICMIGNYVYNNPTTVQLKATMDLLDLGVRLEKLAANYTLLPHNATTPTLSPGANMYASMKDWPHFSRTLSRVL